MLTDKIRPILNWLHRAITQPREELNRWQRAARFAYELGRFGAKKLEHDRAPQMAAALAFRTLFSLAPVLVVTTILVKAFKGPGAILDSLDALLTGLGLDDIYVANGVGDNGQDEPLTLAAWLQELTSELMGTNLTAVGWIGMALILYAAIGLLVTIENCFNIIYRAPEGRSWINRVLLYWFLLTLSPAMIGLANYVHDGFTTWIASVDAWQWLLFVARTLWSFCLAWLFMLMVYTLLPNCRVRLRPALAGAFVATLLLAIGRQSLGAYLGSAFSINQLYGALGLVPLFMFWVYLMWLAVLFGLQVAATLQALRGRALEEMGPPKQQSGMVEPTSVLTVMETIAERFTAGRATTVEEISSNVGLPSVVVARIVENLVQDGWLHRLERPEAAVSLARPPTEIQIGQLMDSAFRMIDGSNPGGETPSIVEQLRAAQHAAVQGMTLAGLVEPVGST